MADKRTILVADDNASFLKAVSIRLERAGYEVITATDGYFALQRAVEHVPDLMILDIHMPAGDGPTVQQRKESIASIADIPVIYVSGDKSEEARAALDAIGALHLIHKPFEFAELLAVIEGAISSPTG